MNYHPFANRIQLEMNKFALCRITKINHQNNLTFHIFHIICIPSSKWKRFFPRPTNRCPKLPFLTINSSHKLFLLWFSSSSRFITKTTSDPLLPSRTFNLTRRLSKFTSRCPLLVLPLLPQNSWIQFLYIQMSIAPLFLFCRINWSSTPWLPKTTTQFVVNNSP